jgi:2-haloacid dehalogenase
MPFAAPVKAVVFDAYGTLFDIGSPAAKVLGGRHEVARLTALWRAKQLEYTWLRSLMSVHADFWRVTQDALDYSLEALNLGDPALRAALLDCYRTLDAYPDAAPAVETLRGGGLRTAILSNGTPELLAQALASAGLERAFDAVLSVEAAGVYKPSPKVYALASGALGVAPAEIAFVSSNGWDVAGGAQFGFQAVHVNRTSSPAERLPASPRAVISSLVELPKLVIAAPAN